MSEEILTIEEVARYLRISERTVYEWAQKGKIPSGKVGTVWRFRRSEVERWVDTCLSCSHRQSHSDVLPIERILSTDRILHLEQSERRPALYELSDCLSTAPQIKNRSELAAEIVRREELMSTAIGCGIAVPHVRLSSVTDLVMAVGISKKGIADFGPLDGQDVHLVFMIAAATNQHRYYLQTLSFFSSKLKRPDLRTRLLQTNTALEAYTVLTEQSSL
ncbi:MULTISPECIES: PTS sugar transporter subunit IIA [Treponema]|uniref:PTS family fructose/mannitol (Fru) porter component IIA n=6 Tax=Treponema TaxID=157 RepID=F7XTH2_TREPU|nr:MULTISPECIES: PTS sugar transporter subunit IIA [Treponema]AEH40684.1 PTS family fructose/mannitol (fru) porter component IIA [Treponema paraluiscuniculi Cuniculi A]AEZ57882.1 PTS family fructose/mannitol (fru) porter component IIA [Treponema pallidum subsp. pertenue str. SamoaD]AEZ58951.1 PTS family fructose/mannitol (fru) porter component IIA [Treponema pallidum subsp. pertenue str. CDC2]AEZ60019.1 PTS family fructose/mannitol (fru) porter component IIA [Treponema pallidum subsp. pertenue 